jgi:hypothetical protein
MAPDEWPRMLERFQRTAWHLERQPFYNVELESFDAWRAGDRTSPAERWAPFSEWRDLIEGHVAAGRIVERVRIETEPPSEYQLFERWAAEAINIPAGEVVHTIPVSRAQDVGLATTGADWWLLDGEVLLVLPFDPEGNLGVVTMTTDPGEVAEATREWRLAVQHSDHQAVTTA